MASFFKSESQTPLIIAVLFAAILISGSLVFLGIQMGGGGGDIQDDIRTGIETYVKEKEAEYNAGQKPAEPQIQVNSSEYMDDDPVLGDEDAPVVIVEFSDYQCPYCEIFYSETYPELKAKYIETGKVKLVYRDFPLSFHAGAYPAALAGECLREQEGDTAYFAFHNKVFENQEVLEKDPELTRTALADFAVEIGANAEDFNECVASDKYRAEINADMNDGQAIGVSGTPSFLVGDTLIVGAQKIDAFDQAISAELAK